MNNIRIATNTSTELVYNAEASLLIARFSGFQKSEQAAKDNVIIIETIRQKRVTSLLMNQRELKVLSREMQAWIMDNATVMLNSGVKKLAVVLPEDVFALAAISKIHTDTKFTGIETKLFQSEEEGLEWFGRYNSIF